jgi:hypothetical protein
MRNALILAAALVAAPVPYAPAQVSTVDEGRFIITRGGERVGTEDFKIRRASDPTGDVLTATATVAYDDRRLSPMLRTDATGAPLAYQVEVRVGSELRERMSGQIGRGRFSARVRTPSGESAKEYIVSDGALVLDDSVFHQYALLARAERSGSVPVVIPRRNVQVVMRVEHRGSETVTIGGQSTQARHLVLTAPGEAPRHVWLDAKGRVLRVRLEGSDMVATRDELPR